MAINATKLLFFSCNRQFSTFVVLEKEFKLECIGTSLSRSSRHSHHKNDHKRINKRFFSSYKNNKYYYLDAKNAAKLSSENCVYKSCNTLVEEEQKLHARSSDNNYHSFQTEFIKRNYQSVIGLGQNVNSLVQHQISSSLRELEDWLLRDVQIEDPEIFMSFDEMVASHGYHLEPHEVETEDGYILSLVRISKRMEISPLITTTEKHSPKPAVLLVHGFQCSAVSWFLNNPQNILPYMLVDEGYDCFVANLRGTPNSKLHTSLSSESKEFWDFSWDEMGRYDIPSLINYISGVTNNSDLYYIGHSMGCTVFFVAMSMKPDYASKVKAMVALGPAVYGKFLRNKPLKFCVAPIASFIGKVKYLSHQELFGRPFSEQAKILCPPLRSPEKVGGYIGRKYGQFFGGLGTDQIEESRIAKIAAHWPQSTSVKSMCHGMQCINNKRFERFDYGDLENHQRYGTHIAPLYDLSLVSVPVATFYSNDDELCSSDDVTQLSQDLPNVIGNYGILQNNFTHGDFIFGKDAHSLVYKPIIRIFQQISTKDKS